MRSKPKRVDVPESETPHQPIVRAFASDEQEYMRDLFANADNFRLVDMRLPRDTPGYSTDAPDIEAAKGVADLLFHSPAMLSRRPIDRKLLLYATKGVRQALIATIFPAGTTSFPVMPGKYKEESNQWTTDGEWKLREPKPTKNKRQKIPKSAM
jgi:transposase